MELPRNLHCKQEILASEINDDEDDADRKASDIEIEDKDVEQILKVPRSLPYKQETLSSDINVEEDDADKKDSDSEMKDKEKEQSLSEQA